MEQELFNGIVAIGLQYRLNGYMICDFVVTYQFEV